MLPVEVLAGTKAIEITSLTFTFDITPAVGKKIVLPTLVAVNDDPALVGLVDVRNSKWQESDVALSFATFKAVEDTTFQKGKAYKLLLAARIAGNATFVGGCTVTVQTPAGTLNGVGYTDYLNKRHEVMLNFGAPTNFITVKSYELKLNGFALGKGTGDITADIYINGKRYNRQSLPMNVDPVGILTTTDPKKAAFVYETLREKKQYYLSVMVEQPPNHLLSFDNLGLFTVNGVKAFKKVDRSDKYTTRYELLFKLPVLHKHTYVTKYTKATLTANGKQYKACSICGQVASGAVSIKKIASVKLSSSAYTYNGKVKTPTVTVKDSAGKTVSSKYYTVKYAAGRKTVGKYKVTITFKGKYSGSKTLYFSIKPPKTTVSSLSANKKSMTVSITRKTTQVTGYIVQYSTSKTFKSAISKTISSNKVTRVTFRRVSANKTYYVRVRTYKKVGSAKYYASWSDYKAVKTR